MNICIVTHKLLKGDGQARVNYEIVKEVLQRNHQVTLYASEVAPELSTRPNASWIKVPVSGWPTQLLKNQIFAVISALKLLPRRKQYDLIIVNGFITWVKSDINAVHFVHSSWLKSPAHPFRLRKDGFGWYQLAFTSINAALEKIAFARTRFLVPVSEKVRSEVQAICSASQLRVIMNGVDVDEFYPDRSLSRGQLGLPEHVPLALFAGDIKSPRKNLDSVLRALAGLPELHLAVAGSTGGSPYLKLAEQLGVDRRVHFLGYRKDMANVMRCADFFVFPSRYEACTLAVIEALASGLPVITTYQSGVSELIAGDSPSGFVLEDPEDVAGLRRAMRTLSANPELRRELGFNARAIAERQSWQSVAAKYIGLFEEAAALNRTDSDAPGIAHSVRSQKL
ncbi:glycosyltransferase family 4 protein [Paenibacillus piri]|uniref:Glycosyltransferase family 1 protein n=1 Tax=Paenibacillus piri TaxID=2547395 RepID=A0A4R5KYK5_9BACL|nr:glycosyltransferase family 4 protein [Paenibacillus piri]TDG00316.1 glycosyltransferase family 1 protein [Paenibacillus piri]